MAEPYSETHIEIRRPDNSGWWAVFAVLVVLAFVAFFYYYGSTTTTTVTTTGTNAMGSEVTVNRTVTEPAAPPAPAAP